LSNGALNVCRPLIAFAPLAPHWKVSYILPFLTIVHLLDVLFINSFGFLLALDAQRGRASEEQLPSGRDAIMFHVYLHLFSVHKLKVPRRKLCERSVLLGFIR